ncbi:MAG: hypothetical protein IVW55_14085 [Chloroflexi bacterium]|nr:hypothetical protein [Chloroflexota bacterium]
MGVPFEERNISSSPEAKREFLDKGYEFLPVIEAGNTVITDYTGEPLLIEVLAREGYL